MPKAVCTITIDESEDGRLNIAVNIPDDAKDTIAEALARTLLANAADVMNSILETTEVVREVVRN
jgi:hypothetical protein